MLSFRRSSRKFSYREFWCIRFLSSEVDPEPLRQSHTKQIAWEAYRVACLSASVTGLSFLQFSQACSQERLISSPGANRTLVAIAANGCFPPFCGITSACERGVSSLEVGASAFCIRRGAVAAVQERSSPIRGGSVRWQRVEIRHLRRNSRAIGAVRDRGCA